MRKFIAVLLLASLSTTASAAPVCWNNEDVDAAKVRDLQTLITLVGQRCEAAGQAAVAGDRDAFLAANRSAFSATGQRLKARFWTVYGRDEGQRLLDSFDGSIGQQYANVPAIAENCAQVGGLAREAAAARGSVRALVAVAERNNLLPALPGGSCATKLAALERMAAK